MDADPRYYPRIILKQNFSTQIIATKILELLAEKIILLMFEKITKKKMKNSSFRWCTFHIPSLLEIFLLNQNCKPKYLQFLVSSFKNMNFQNKPLVERFSFASIFFGGCMGVT